MSKKIVTIQDISCYGQCSITVALPILSAYGIETAILPSAILSTHTSGFKDFTVLDLTEEMPKIIQHWIKENILFDAIYTGYIGDVRQFDLILECKEKLLNGTGLFIVDPAMADNGKLYPALDMKIVEGMKKIVSVSDYCIPNITEACLLTDTPYKSNFTEKEIENLLKKLYAMGSKHIILTGYQVENKIGAIAYDGKDKIIVLKEKQLTSYHGTGDIFSSVIVANILNHKDLKENLNDATEFIIQCIKKTISDSTHSYGVKFEDVLYGKK